MERYQKIFKEYSYENNKFSILGISLDDNKKVYLLGFKKEKNAEKAKEIFENISNVTVFSVDFYGNSTIEEAENYYKSLHVKTVAFSVTNTDTAIIKNPKALVKQVNDKLK